MLNWAGPLWSYMMEWRLYLLKFWKSALYGCELGELQAPAALSQVKYFQYSVNRRLVECKDSVWTRAEDEGSYLCRESNCSHPAHFLITTLNEMSLFRIIPVLIYRFQNYFGREIGRVVTTATNGRGLVIRNTGRVGVIFLSLGLATGKEMLGVS